MEERRLEEEFLRSREVVLFVSIFDASFLFFISVFIGSRLEIILFFVNIYFSEAIEVMFLRVVSKFRGGGGLGVGSGFFIECRFNLWW